MHLLFLISLDRVQFDGIKLKVSLEKIDRPRYITPTNEADDLSSSVLRNVIAWKLGIAKLSVQHPLAE